ncbi:hypothetical protein evm_004490 [Chilo suppressalis]|nr:hypothetical protein evm_004490 [Chilo suppressalis]
MKLLLIFQIHLLCFINNSSTQFPAFFQPAVQASFYETAIMGYPLMGFPQRHQDRPGGYINGRMMPFFKNYDYADSEECMCSCSDCERPKPCCRQMCLSCNQPNVFIMPYPYPIIITTTESTKIEDRLQTDTPPATNPPSSTQTSSTTAATTKSTTFANADGLDIDLRQDLNSIGIDETILNTPRKGGDSKYILTSVRRTKSDRTPKYGIVPIPKRLAERLMSQLRHMKDINSV